MDSLARTVAAVGLPHPIAVDVAREAIASGRWEDATEIGRERARSLLVPVVNATGVLLHTNLGRAPLPVRGSPPQPIRATNLELDLSTGRRGSRNDRAGALAARACGAQAALVVNNGAAAVLLVLAALASGRDVVVSRGELVEIGGGFRIPDVLASSGARMVEVGTTNRTRRADYEAALAGRDVAAVVKVHQSNFKMAGFVESVGTRDLASLGVPVVVDLGSGLLDANTPWLKGPPPKWLAGEPAAVQTLAEGAALVTFSGDKLLGGPQAGIIAGRAELVAACARHPLARALRPGGLVLDALQSTLLSYLGGSGADIPFWRMATTPLDALAERAKAIGVGSIVSCKSVPGAGSLPGLELDSVGVAIEGDHLATLRGFDPPVIARAYDGMTVADLRSVDPSDDAIVAKALGAASRSAGPA